MTDPNCLEAETQFFVGVFVIVIALCCVWGGGINYPLPSLTECEGERETQKLFFMQMCFGFFPFPCSPQRAREGRETGSVIKAVPPPLVVLVCGAGLKNFDSESGCGMQQRSGNEPEARMPTVEILMRGGGEKFCSEYRLIGQRISKKSPEKSVRHKKQRPKKGHRHDVN